MPDDGIDAGSRAVIDELTSVRLELGQMNERIRQMGNMLLLAVLAVLVTSGLLAAIAFGWLEVAVHFDNAGGR